MAHPAQLPECLPWQSDKADGVPLPAWSMELPDSLQDTVLSILSAPHQTAHTAIEALERACENETGAPYAIALSSRSAALYTCIIAAGCGVGDLVLVPTLAPPTAANATRLAGAHPVFVDVASDTGLMTVATLEAALNGLPLERVKACIPYAFAGQPAYSDPLHTLCAEKGIVLIEDCDTLEGLRRLGKTELVNSSSAYPSAVFSLPGQAPWGEGEGGVLITHNEYLAHLATDLRSLGLVSQADRLVDRHLSFDEEKIPLPWAGEIQTLGQDFRPPAVSCAIALSHLPGHRTRREHSGVMTAWYRHSVQENAIEADLVGPADEAPAPTMPIVNIDFSARLIRRADVMRAFLARGFETRVPTIPLHQQPYYKGLYGERRLAGAEKLFKGMLTLPMPHTLQRAQAETVIATLKDLLAA